MRVKTFNYETVKHLMLTQPASLYPKHHATSEVVVHATAQLPITDTNDLLAILAMYRNSLLQAEDIKHVHKH